MKIGQVQQGQTNRTVRNNKQNTIIRHNEEKETCMLIDVAILEGGCDQEQN